MDVVRPVGIEAALEARAARPDAVALSGGTDVMVDLNFDRLRPPALLDLSRVPELGGWETGDGSVRLGARLTHAEVVAELGDAAARARRRVAGDGLGQIRNRGTLGGNVGTASPSGDALCALVAAGAEVELRRSAVRGGCALADFVRGPKETALRPRRADLRAARPAPPAGPQRYAKVARAQRDGHGHLLARRRARRRRAAACPSRRAARARRRCARPRPRRSPPRRSTGTGSGRSTTRPRGASASSCVAAADPQDDVRGTAAYRRHALARARPPLPRLGLGGAPVRLTCTVNGARARGRRRLGGREPAARAARPPRPDRHEERLRAGRVRLLLDLPRRPRGVRLPRARRAGGGRRDRHRRGPAPTAGCTRCRRRSWPRAPCSAASARRAWS